MLYTPENFSKEDYKFIVEDVISAYEIQHQYDPLTTARFGACLVRFTGHDFMDFRMGPGGETFGGADGCVDLFDPSNTGLQKCLEDFDILQSYERSCHLVSLADYSVIMSEAIMGRLSPDYTAEDKFNPDFLLGKFLRQFKFGRVTANSCEEHRDKLPSPNLGCFGEGGGRSVKAVFVDNLFGSVSGSAKKWRMTAAIIGAHTFGGGNENITGKTALWSDVHNQGKFNNDFFVNMIQNGWTRDLVDNADLGIVRPQWKRTGGVDDNSDLPHFMLNTDLCLAYQIGDVG